VRDRFTYVQEIVQLFLTLSWWSVRHVSIFDDYTTENKKYAGVAVAEVVYNSERLHSRTALPGFCIACHPAFNCAR
jgi:hypothetical protein